MTLASEELITKSIYYIIHIFMKKRSFWQAMYETARNPSKNATNSSEMNKSRKLPYTWWTQILVSAIFHLFSFLFGAGYWWVLFCRCGQMTLLKCDIYGLWIPNFGSLILPFPATYFLFNSDRKTHKFNLSPKNTLQFMWVDRELLRPDKVTSQGPFQVKFGGLCDSKTDLADINYNLS